MKERKALMDAKLPVSIRAQADLLEVDRSSFYYKPIGETQENLKLMLKIDELFLEDPTLGVLGMQDALSDFSLSYNHKRIRRLMRKMCLDPIYPKRNLSKLGKVRYIHPYLLRDLTITQPNQVWAIDITYIPMKSGFMYLTAIIDVYSRFIVGWQISNSLAQETQTAVLRCAIERYGKPQIINSEGAQCTCEHWVSTIKELEIRIFMDDKGIATDNAIIERFFGTLKRKQIYLYPAKDGLDLYSGIEKFMKKYNLRNHRGINRKKPQDLYLNAA